ncbi:MAG: aminopeptidase, partial [Planctomycetota bacterium]
MLTRLPAFLVIFCLATVNATAEVLPHSFANIEECRIKHLHLDLDVDFDARQLVGSAELMLDRQPNCDSVTLDTNGLQIRTISEAGKNTKRVLDYVLGDQRGVLGRGLTVQLPPGVDKIRIEYATRPGAAALQWLTPEQTTDKKQPFLFTQSQAILARTWVPCQDTPAVRMTYSAKLRVPSELLAVMSAANPQVKNETGEYSFEMKQAIPSYLLALAVGDLQFVDVSERCGIYAEPSVVKKAA